MGFKNSIETVNNFSINLFLRSGIETQMVEMHARYSKLDFNTFGYSIWQELVMIVGSVLYHAQRRLGFAQKCLVLNEIFFKDLCLRY